MEWLSTLPTWTYVAGYIVAAFVCGSICCALFKVDPKDPVEIIVILVAAVLWPIVVSITIGYAFIFAMLRTGKWVGSKIDKIFFEPKRLEAEKKELDREKAAYEARMKELERERQAESDRNARRKANRDSFEQVQDSRYTWS